MFSARHIGTSPTRADEMAREIGYYSISALIDATVPTTIRIEGIPELKDLPSALSEPEALARLRATMEKNVLRKSYLGLGYHAAHTPPVIQRCILENPGWYTAYTPYQAEISQGRLEMLLNFQTLITDITGLDVANASLLDEGTAAAEAVTLAASQKSDGTTVFVAETCHSHVIDVVRTRSEAVGLTLVVGDPATFDPASVDGLFAVLLSYPDTLGRVHDWSDLIRKTHEAGALAIVSADLLSLTLLKTPGEMGADIAVGNSQRFGVPLGFGGPHAAYMAVTDPLKRKLPGRLVGVSHDSKGRPAYRLALQTREQHIRRDKATSNICTAQVLLAVIATAYAIYHGPEGLRAIASRVHQFATRLAIALGAESNNLFDTVLVSTPNAAAIIANAEAAGYNLRRVGSDQVLIALDETTTETDLHSLVSIFGAKSSLPHEAESTLTKTLPRSAPLLAHPVFHSYHTETEMLRYLRRLQGKDIALDHSMIALGSCTMKLNAASEMMPLSWPEVASLHPYAPAEQTEGYRQMFAELESWLATITGFAAVSLQPNAGSQGEYAGLLAIRRHLDATDGRARNACLIPLSAHGTNPASAVMVGFKVVPVACDEEGNIDLADLHSKIATHRDTLAALMVTYPSTHGVFETAIQEICESVHAAGGQVYMDGANMNAQVGLTSPAKIGADVCHLNLHKTFCIPHGGGGPGVGPIGVAAHLAPYLPGHELLSDSTHAVSSAPWGSASICTISWMYIAMMGQEGLRTATEIAILNANYIAHRIRPYFPVLYTGSNGLVAHECIIDLRDFAEVTVEDVAKRLADFGYHSPTMSWPVAGTLMIEPTESESPVELDRFCEAMIAIHSEILAIREGTADPTDNVLKNAPHPAVDLMTGEWTHPYSREAAAYPAPWLRENKYWPPVSRIDNVHGDRNLICSCAPMEDYDKTPA